jgi:hypothetical protein
VRTSAKLHKLPRAFAKLHKLLRVFYLKSPKRSGYRKPLKLWHLRHLPNTQNFFVPATRRAGTGGGAGGNY